MSGKFLPLRGGGVLIGMLPWAADGEVIFCECGFPLSDLWHATRFRMGCARIRKRWERAGIVCFFS